MAMNLRLEDKQEFLLEQLQKKLNISTKSKTIIWLIENIEEIEEEKLRWYKDAREWREKYIELKKAIAARDDYRTKAEESDRKIQELVYGTDYVSRL